MSIITHILAETDEVYLARIVGNKYDDAFAEYVIQGNRVSSEREYYNSLRDFYIYMVNRCQQTVRNSSVQEAESKAIQIVSQAYSKQSGNAILAAFRDASQGLNKGLRGQFDMITEHMRNEAYQLHVEYVLRKYISNVDFNQQVAAVKDILEHFKNTLPNDIDCSTPERYVYAIKDIVHIIMKHIKTTGNEFRRF